MSINSSYDLVRGNNYLTSYLCKKVIDKKEQFKVDEMAPILRHIPLIVISLPIAIIAIMEITMKVFFGAMASLMTFLRVLDRSFSEHYTSQTISHIKSIPLLLMLSFSIITSINTKESDARVRQLSEKITDHDLGDIYLMQKKINQMENSSIITKVAALILLTPLSITQFIVRIISVTLVALAKMMQPSLYVEVLLTELGILLDSFSISTEREALPEFPPINIKVSHRLKKYTSTIPALWLVNKRTRLLENNQNFLAFMLGPISFITLALLTPIISAEILINNLSDNGNIAPIVSRIEGPNNAGLCDTIDDAMHAMTAHTSTINHLDNLLLLLFGEVSMLLQMFSLRPFDLDRGLSDFINNAKQLPSRRMHKFVQACGVYAKGRPIRKNMKIIVFGLAIINAFNNMIVGIKEIGVMTVIDCVSVIDGSVDLGAPLRTFISTSVNVLVYTPWFIILAILTLIDSLICSCEC